jgi:hypothetical protein
MVRPAEEGNAHARALPRRSARRWYLTSPTAAPSVPRRGRLASTRPRSSRSSSSSARAADGSTTAWCAGSMSGCRGRRNALLRPHPRAEPTARVAPRARGVVAVPGHRVHVQAYPELPRRETRYEANCDLFIEDLRGRLATIPLLNTDGLTAMEARGAVVRRLWRARRRRRLRAARQEFLRQAPREGLRPVRTRDWEAPHHQARGVQRPRSRCVLHVLRRAHQPTSPSATT